MNTAARGSALEKWQGEFGDEYTERNSMTFDAYNFKTLTPTGRTLAQIWDPLLSDCMDAAASVLEIGCNVGLALQLLRAPGVFSKLCGIEPNTAAADKARARGFDVLNIPVEQLEQEAMHDLVFTSGVLMHIPPSRLTDAITRIVRASKRWIAGLEYYSPEPVECEYRGQKGLFWKRDFMQAYLDHFPLIPRKVEVLDWKEEGKTGLYLQAFLLEKA